MLTVTENDLFRRLEFDNPWWGFTSETEIKFRHPPRRVFFPAFFSRVMKAGAGEVLVLAGPLRAGKTVMIRQMLAQLIEQGVEPRSVFYCSLTTPSYTAADLKTLFGLFTRRHQHGQGAELYVFFDEAQYVGDWRDALPALAGEWPNAKFVAAVSSGAPQITTGKTSADGRTSVFVLPPLTFLEFLRFRDSEEKLFGAGAGEAGSRMVVHPGALPALNAEFHRYVNFGGFPEGVMLKTGGRPAPTFIRDGVADRVLHKDLAGRSGVNDVQELNRLFSILAFNTAREVTMEDLAKAAGIAKNTVRKYLDYLESAFLVRRLPRVDRHARPFQRAVAFKIHLTAPCLYAALFGPVPAASECFERLAETALVAQWLGSDAVDSLAYASWRGGGIDLLSIDPASGKPDHVYEMDWSDTGQGAGPGQGAKRLAAFVERTNPAARPYVLTRSLAKPAVLGGTEITLAPVSLYAYWLQRDPTLKRFHSGETGGEKTA